MSREFLRVLLAAGFGWLGLVLLSDDPATAHGSHRGMSRRERGVTPAKRGSGTLLRWPAT